MLNRFASILVGWAFFASAQSSTLDELLAKSDFVVFVSQATAAAEQGDAEALFLLGKAHHLGKGVAVDEARARDYYERARARGSARASHNLGTLALEQGMQSEAIALLEEALARGLNIPTLYNLGRAHSPPDSVGWPSPGVVQSAELAGGYYARAYAIDSNINTLSSAAREYLRAYHFALLASRAHDGPFDLPAMRARALEWLLRGTAADNGPSWTNYGALLQLEGDLAGARHAFEHGARLGMPLAHHQLALMFERSSVQPRQGESSTRDMALFHHEQAALLGIEASRRRARDLLIEHLMGEFSLDALERGMHRLAALHQADDFDDTLVLRERLAWGRFYEASRARLRPLPKGPLALRACGMGADQPHGEAHYIRQNARWQLVAYTDHGTAQPLGISGHVSQRGCVAVQTLPSRLRRMLERGDVLALRFTNVTLPLRWHQRGDAVGLDLEPLGTPAAPR